MLRIVAIIGLALATLGGAVAGNIVPIDLTTATVGTGTCNTAGTCVPVVSTTSTGTFENTLFTTQIVPSSITTGPSAQTVGPTQFILNAQANTDDEYISAAGNNRDTSILIDLGTCTGVTAPTTACGLSNVDALYTMIQANGDVFGDQGITITLNGVTAGLSAITGTIDLTAGVDYRAANSTIASSETCTDANSNNPTNNVGTACTVQNSATAEVTGSAHATAGTLSGNMVVTTNNGLGAETSGNTNYFLDVQELELGNNFLNGAFLNSITITSNSPSGGNSKILFSGLSADQVTATPEPGTVAFLGIGLGLIAIRKIRARRADRLPALD